MKDKETKSQGYSLSYFAAKSCLLMAYYTILERFALNTIDFKFQSFMILTPVVKFWHFNKLQDKKDLTRFIYSIVNDLIHAAIYFKMFVPVLVGIHFAWFPLLLSAVFIIFELLQYKILYNDGSYEILSTGRFEDNLLSVVMCSAFYVASRGVDFEKTGMGEAYSFVVFLFLVLLFDLTFGWSHYLTHNIPSLWRLHAIHHKYKREKLNAFASFYADIWDSLIMNCSLTVTAFGLVVGFGRYHTSYMDLIYAAFATHLRYVENQMNLMFFFEWDLIDMALKKNRIASYHAMHHHDSNINFGAYGILSDQVFKALNKNFAKSAKSHDL